MKCAKQYLAVLLITVCVSNTEDINIKYFRAPELLVFALSLWRDAACLRAPKVYSSFHYFPQGRNSGTLQELAYYT